MMIKFFASMLLSGLILLQGLNIHVKDILDLQTFLQHLEYHQSADGDNFYSFLEKHYGLKMAEHEHEDGSNDEKHDKLPFKDKAYNNTVSFLMVTAGNSSQNLISPTISSKSTFFYQDNYSFLDQTDIFQPPRIL